MGGGGNQHGECSTPPTFCEQNSWAGRRLTLHLDTETGQISLDGGRAACLAGSGDRSINGAAKALRAQRRRTASRISNGRGTHHPASSMTHAQAASPTERRPGRCGLAASCLQTLFILPECHFVWHGQAGIHAGGSGHPWPARTIRRHPCRLVAFGSQAGPSSTSKSSQHRYQTRHTRPWCGEAGYRTSCAVLRIAGPKKPASGSCAVSLSPLTPLPATYLHTGRQRSGAHRRPRTPASLISGRNSCSGLKSTRTIAQDVTSRASAERSEGLYLGRRRSSHGRTDRRVWKRHPDKCHRRNAVPQIARNKTRSRQKRRRKR